MDFVEVFLSVYSYGMLVSLGLFLFFLFLEKWRVSKIRILHARLAGIGLMYDIESSSLISYNAAAAVQFERDIIDSRSSTFLTFFFVVGLSWVGFIFDLIVLRISLKSISKLRRGLMGYILKNERSITDSDLLIYVNRIDWANFEDKC